MQPTLATVTKVIPARPAPAEVTVDYGLMSRTKPGQAEELLKGA